MTGKATSYESDIILGEKYRDEQTGIEGTVTAVIFFQHGCERADLEVVNDGKLEHYSFDSPRLTNVSTGKESTSERTGGPARESATLRR